MNQDLISRQAAIDAIKAYFSFADWKPSVKEILEMAVNDTTDMLERLPSAQPEHLVKESGNLVNGLVNDCISREAAIDALNKMKIYRPLDSDRYVISDCLNKIVNLPSAQTEHTETHSCVDNRTETHDLVSRRAALEAIDTWDKFGCDPDGKLARYDDDKHYVPYVRYEDMVYAVKNLPPAQPEWIPCEGCEKRCEKWENSKT